MPSSKALLDEIQRNHFASFLAGAYPIVAPGPPLVWGWHLDAMAHALNGVERLAATKTSWNASLGRMSCVSTAC